MEIIDFDERFSDYLNAWIDKHKKEFKHAEDMEDAVPDVYLKWLNTPADWLNGQTPGSYYEQWSDAAELTRLLVDYINTDNISVPDPLLDRLQELGDEEPLLALARDEGAPAEARMHAIELLRQLDSRTPMVDYIRWQVERTQDEELLDNALESLHQMGEDARRPAKVAFLAANEDGKEALLDLLSDYTGDEDVFGFALHMFKTTKDKRALYASYLGKLDDDHALEALLDVAEGDDVSYIDFIEIRNAIERLGGEAPLRDEDFLDDPTYIAVKNLQKR